MRPAPTRRVAAGAGLGALVVLLVVSSVALSGAAGPLPAEAVGEAPGTWAATGPALSRLSRAATAACLTEAAVRMMGGDGGANLRAAREAYQQQSDSIAIGSHAPLAPGNGLPAGSPAVPPPFEVAFRGACPRLTLDGLAATSAGRPASTPDGNTRYYARFLSPADLDTAAMQAGWPDHDGWWPQMRAIILCENATLDTWAYNPGDPNGGSFGLAQLNGSQHFDQGGEHFEQWRDPVVNLRTALWVRTLRGHFGGPGGWMVCADRLGIP